MHKNCYRSYLIYEKQTEFEQPVGLVFSVRQLADWLGVSEREASRIASGKAEHREFGLFVDELTPEERGQYTATTAPSYHLSQRAKK